MDVMGKSYYQCIWRDITEQKQAEEERKKLQAQLAQSQKMESVGRLAGGVDFSIEDQSAKVREILEQE